MRLPFLLALCLLLAPTLRATPDDTRAGVVADRQGTALVRPAGRERWTPLDPRNDLLPGDEVKTPVRGANAVEIRLPGGNSVVLGPGGLLELPERGTVHLLAGDLEATGSPGTPLLLQGPGGFEAKLTARAVVRGAGKTTETLAEDPRWLLGYRASTTDEWMGSLVARIDGRDVPLTVGYHKVTVDIRDQIARTTIEESFVNSTTATLEGVFYFPLPADASISGFGMWIGDELVEADIVEKQRARAIYEDILRRKKDPGLLEWSGGNLFKARVFPIPGGSEKRIRIQYTQVLPLEGTRLRYRYALRSELLRAHPLRQLRIDVSVSSTMPIRSIASPTHEVRAKRTDHAATADFEAEEDTPQRDFEIDIEVERGDALTVVPHRRADDGYFMLLLSPPDPAQGQWQRELTPERGPLDLLLLADTSGSMHRAAREAQAAFVGSLLSLLGPNDRFRLLATDVDVHPFRDGPSQATDAEAAAALDFLSKRPSLGWTDLDKAFAAALSAAGPGTVVVYVGDGIGTTGDADPQALAQRLRALGMGGAKDAPVCHAVAVSSTYEKPVLEAIAGIGGGSVRETGDDPAAAAFGLLSEAAQPVVKDLKVSFEGIRTARVYPARLPNLPAGRQQVVLGRFLPTGGDQHGKVIVTGTLQGKPVRYAADFLLREGEEGNSFVPRLWARHHIDALLAEGNGKEVTDEIVSFSAEMGIMTPLTSFLVLENDDDRARYGVERRVRMRDGERFFAEGRDQASTELLADQMKRAQGWRLRLRAQMLREIATLGKQLSTVAVGWGPEEAKSVIGFGGGAGGRFQGPNGATSPIFFSSKKDEVFGDEDSATPVFGAQAEEAPEEEEGATDAPMAAESPEDSNEDSDFEPPGLREPGEPPSDSGADEDFEESAERPSTKMMERANRLGGGGGKAAFRDSFLGKKARYVRPPADGDLSSLGFPGLSDPPPPEPPTNDPNWAAEVIALLRSIDRRSALDALDGGIDITERGGAIHALRGEETSWEYARGLYGKAGWFVRTAQEDQQPYDRWLFGGRRAIVATGIRVGRERAAEDGDHLAFDFPFSDFSLVDLVRTYAAWEPGAVSREGTVATVVLKSGTSELRLRIDMEKRVVLSVEWFRDRKPSGSTRFSDFTQVSGLWWARRVETLDVLGRVVHRLSVDVKPLAADAIDKAVSGHEDVLFVGAKDPTLGEAKQSVFDRRAGVAERLRLVAHFMASQQWDRAFEHFDAIDVGGKPAEPWLRTGLLVRSRRGTEAKELLTKMARTLAKADERDSTGFLLQLLVNPGGVYQRNELLEILSILGPAIERDTRRRFRYETQRAWALYGAGRPAEGAAILLSLAKERPFDSQAVLACAQILRQTLRADEAARLLAESIEGHDWLPAEAYGLCTAWTDSLWEEGDVKALAAATAAWVKRDPPQEDAYQRYLASLLFSGREADADAWVAARLKEGLSPEATEAEQARLGAAISYCLGNGWNFWAQSIEERWWAPLRDLALSLARRDDPSYGLASRILSDGRFQRTDASAEARKALLSDLLAEGAIEGMSPTRLGFHVQWTPWGRNMLDEAAWQNIVSRVEARWTKTEEKNERRQLGGFVLILLDQHGEKDRAIAFLRKRLDRAEPDFLPQVAGDLAQRLAQEPWTQPIEEEILALVPRMLPPDPTREVERAFWMQQARWLADVLEGARQRALLGEPKEQEKLSRAELRQRQRETRVAARRGLAERFGRLEGPWFALERLTLLAELGDDPKEVDGAARELMLGVKAEDTTNRILRERCAYVIAYLATRTKAPAGLADAAVALFRERLKAEPAEKADGTAIDWKAHLFRLLVALDRTDEVTALLREWIVPKEALNTWRVALGYLLAEHGALAEAAAAFEAVARADELGNAEWSVLADWYLVLGDAAKREDALYRRYAVMPEWELNQRVYREASRVSRGGDEMPDSLDPDVSRAMRALLSKASYPASYIGSVQNLYRAVKDFRLLECLPYGVLGHTPEGLYPFLEQVGSVVGQVHEEATCDQLALRIAELSVGATTDTDRRGLRLLEAVVERRAAEVKNAPGPHADKGLAALRAAAAGSWLAGERRLMASFLASLGRIPQAPFAEEQTRELADLHRGEAQGTIDRLEIARMLASTHWAYGRADEAIDFLEPAIAEYKAARGGLASEANPSVDALLSWLSARGRYGQAEAFVLAEMASPLDAQQQGWLRQHLFQIYIGALASRGEISLGRGEALYDAARARMETSLFADAPQWVDDTMAKLCQLHRTAQKSAGIRRGGSDLEAFAQGKFAEVASRVPMNAENLASNVASTLHDLNGPRSGLAFLIGRIETEPSWYRRVDRGSWQNHCYQLGEWRVQAGALGDLEPRLLAIVLRELERDLLAMEAPYRPIYWRNDSYFWREERDRFAGVARKVIELNPDSPARLLYAANYLWTGLDLRAEAISTLLDAEGRGRLQETGRATAAGWLQVESRWADSLPLLDRLVADRPDRLDYRVMKVRSLHGVGRDADANALLDETEKRLKEHNAWNEAALAPLARICGECGYLERAVARYEELIPLHQRTHAHRGVGQGTLSTYYGELATCYAGLKRFDEAVDAASAAVVSWGPSHQNRAEALAQVQSVIAAIPDLDAFVVRHDAKVKETGLDAPLLRKYMGLAFLARKQPDRAIPQLLAARDLQPDDGEVHQALLEAYDALGRKQDACAALLDSIDVAPSNLALHAELGKRYAGLGEAEESERAWTGLVEALPNEAESHRMLAEHRAEEKRLGDAVVQWQQVVRVRADEPPGWLGLAKAQIAAGDGPAARASLDHLLGRDWEERFGDVKSEAARLLAALPR